MKKIIITSLLILVGWVAEAQTYYSMHYCKEGYRLRMYETILPSLWHIVNTAICDSAHIWDYYEAGDVLCNIYTDYYKNPEQSVKIMEEVYQTIALNTDSSHHSPLRFAAINLAERYLIVNQFEKAKNFIEKSDKLYKYAGCNCELIMELQMAHLHFYCAINNNAKLFTESKIAIEMYNSFWGNVMDGKDYTAFDIINNLATAYYQSGDTAKAESYWHHIIENNKSQEPQLNSLFNRVINTLALIKMRQHQWQEAMNLYDKVKMFNDLYDMIYYRNYLNCALFVNRLDKVNKFYKLFSNDMVENKSRIFFNSTEENHYNEWLSRVQDIEYYNFAAFKSRSAQVISDAFVSTVFFKTVSLESNSLITEFVNNSDDKHLKNIYEKCRQLKHNLLFSNESFDIKNRYYTEYEKLYDTLVTHTINLSSKMLKQIKTIADIQRALRDNEIAIEFCVIPDYTQYPNHTDYFGAYIIGKNYSSPKLVKLAEVSTVEKLLNHTSEDPMFYSDFYSGTKIKQLYQLIFKPLEPFLNNYRTIFYSLYGNLATLNFDCMKDDVGALLCQKYNLIRVSSTAYIPKVRQPYYLKTAALFGNINYSTSPENMQKSENKSNSRSNMFASIGATKIEIDSINKILQAHNIAVKTYEKDEANEKVFKLLSSNSPDILHFATHGFCLDTDDKIQKTAFAQSIKTNSQKESSMALSGLALSGANNIWKGKFNLQNIEDGILTAYEISQLDLSNTRLAVLSACETAKGRIFPVDGVFGLQRAFKQAGAGAILMSLWKVNDAATSLFMQHFYKSLMQNGDRHKALNFARNEVKKDFPDPYYWAAWVLLD